MAMANTPLEKASRRAVSVVMDAGVSIHPKACLPMMPLRDVTQKPKVDTLVIVMPEREPLHSLAIRRLFGGRTSMKRLNWPLWAGFLLSVIAFFTFFAVFVNFPVTRDFPWANLL